MSERDRFEAWASTEGFNVDRCYDDDAGEYHRATTRWAWRAWQAAENKTDGAVVTEAMVTAYLTANDAYWRKTDELPRNPGRWREGTPSEATRASLMAALAAAPPAPAAEPDGLKFDALGEPRTRYVRVTLDGNHCVMHPSEGDRYVQDARDAGDESNYIVRDVWLSEREFDDLPEHDGF